MTKQYKKLKKEEKEQLRQAIKSCLATQAEVVFAFIAGSFLASDDLIGDIDVAVYLKKDKLESELRVGAKLEKALDYRHSVDVIVLNNAPVALQFNAISRGELLFSRDDIVLADFIERVSVEHIRSAFYRKKSIKEVLAAE